jgi:DNA (cytosine-5)-methyltransferase 1
MKYLSLFSGIEAASAAWNPLGWKCVAVAEIEPFPCAVLKEHYPKVPNLGDVTKVTRETIRDLGKFDVVIFGSPCQDLSVAGKREGIGGARSGLFFTAIEIIKWAREECGARFALWENVPGAFSSQQGRDFAEVVGAMAGCRIDVPEHGWGTEGAAVGEIGLVEWSVLDAQWFGVAQRRRRVFALLDSGNWSRRPPILLEPQGLRGDSAPSREAGQGVTHDVDPCVGASGRGFERAGETRGQDPVVACFGGNNTTGPVDVATARNACASASGRLDFESETFVAFHHNAQAAQLPTTTTDTSKTAALTCSQGAAVAQCATGEVFHTLRAEGFDASEDGTGRGRGAVAVREVSQTLTGNYGKQGDSSDTSMGPNVAFSTAQVRRLTPIECERLQGFPDGHTQIPWRGKPAELCPDGPRYKALGNSMAVPVIRWIGERIMKSLRGT